MRLRCIYSTSVYWRRNGAQRTLTDDALLESALFVADPLSMHQPIRRMSVSIY